MRLWQRLLILVILADGAYVPALQLPFIEDDYGEIPLARSFASAGWGPLWRNPALRTRATSIVLNAALERVWGFTPAPFYAVSIVVHSLCVLLIYAASAWSEILDASTAFWAACFFAVYEGHQEAVMWISARSESLLFLFGMLTWVCWLMYLRTRSARWYCLSIVSFVLAALSKESFVVFPVLMLLPCIWPPEGSSRRTALAGMIPFFAIVIGYLAWTWLGRFAAPDYSDNRFLLTAAWPLVMLRSVWRLIFVWGLVALAILLWTGRRTDRTKVVIALAWILIAVFPYSFLTYMPQIASRHAYIASAGLALLVGTAAARLSAANHRAILGILCLAVLALNLEILWVKKMSQFRERAEPSELLKAAAREADGPVFISCTPFPDFLSEAVVASAGGRDSFRHPGAHDDHCFAVDYKNAAGVRVSIDRRIRTRTHGAFY